MFFFMNSTVMFVIAITLAVILMARILMTFAKSKKAKKDIAKGAVWILFVFYVMILANLLFFDGFYNRSGGGAKWDYTGRRLNIIPFDTIKLYLNSFKQNTLAVSNIAINLIGNAIAFAPMGILLPVLFSRMRKVIPFSLTMLLIVTAVEAIQLIGGVGSCDIDDIILNFSGALITYLIFKLPPLQKLLRKMYL